MSDTEIPTYRNLLLPTLQALDALGGSAGNEALEAKVVEQAGISAAQMAVEFGPDNRQTGPKINHRLAFARSYLKLSLIHI